MVRLRSICDEYSNSGAVSASNPLSSEIAEGRGNLIGTVRPTGVELIEKEDGMENYSPAPSAMDKFTAADLSSLREELLQSGLDSWQAAELIGSFLSNRGYGVSHHAARGAVSRIESVGCSLKCMQEELEKLALVM